MSEYAKKAAECCKTTAKTMAKDPPRTLRWLSTISGLLLVMGGVAGVFTFNPLAAVISVYNIFFGGLIILTELKNFPIIKTFQRKVDVYFHLLSVPRGKGGFYCFIGFLAFFSSDWSLARVCVLIVSVVGVIHLFSCKRCGANEEEQFAKSDSARQQYEMQGMVESGEASGSADDISGGWASLMKQVVSENPELLSSGLSLAANPAVQQAAIATVSAAAEPPPAAAEPAPNDVPSCSRSNTA